MADRKICTLQELTTSINTGLDAIRRAPIVENKTDIRCLRIQDISQEKSFNKWGYTEVTKKDFEKFQLITDDIIMARTCSTGICYLVKENIPAVFNNGLARIRLDKEKAYPQFMYYVFKSKHFTDYIDGISRGTSVQLNMKIGDLEKYEFHLPDLESQKKIAYILGELDNKIQLNTQTNQTLEAIVQAIFKSWFVDFDPVRAKAQAISDGKTSDEANLSAMAVISGKAIEDLSQTEYQQLWEIADAFPSELVENAEFGEVPKGWEVLRVGDIATIIKGKSYKSSELEPSSTALVTLKSFNRGGGYRLDGLKEYSGTYKAEQEVFAGDLIVAYTDVTQAADVIGKPAMVMSDSRYEHLVISLDVGVVRPKNEKFKYFLYCLAMTDLFQNHTKSFCTGTTVLHLAKEAVPSFEFIKPNDNLINLFDNLVSSIFIKINEHIEENKSLEKTRDSLLPKLLNGEI